MEKGIYRASLKTAQRRRGRARHLISLGVVLSMLARPALPAWAQTAPSPSPSASLSAEDFEQVCGPVLTRPAPQHEADLALYNQKLPLCQGAAASHEAMRDQDILWKVWAGVAAVCGLACGASFFGVGSQYICIGTNVAAGVTEGVVTEDFGAAMTGIMSAGASFMVNAVANGALNGGGNSAANTSNSSTSSAPAGTTDGATPASGSGTTPDAGATNPSSSANGNSSGSGSGNNRSESDIGACLSAAMAVMQSVNKHSSARSAEETLTAAMQDLSRLQSVSIAAPRPGSVSFGNQDTSPDSAVAPTTHSSSEEVAVAEPKPDSNRSCSSSASTTGEVISCATALDNTLPGFVKNSKFPQEFQRTSGMGLNDFLGSGRSGSPGSDIGAAMGNLLTPSAQAALKAAADGLADKIAQSDPNIAATAYRGGGARRNGSGGGGDDDFMGQMSGLLGKLLPGGKGAADGKDQSTKAVQAVMQAAKVQGGRVEEDRNLSLFDRVKVRYLAISQAQRILAEAEAKGEGAGQPSVAPASSGAARLPAAGP